MLDRKSITLIELLVVVVIIGALALLGITQYFGVVERSRGAEARGILTQIYRNYKIAVEENVALPAALGVCAGNWDSINMDDPNLNPESWFAYQTSFVVGLEDAVAFRRIAPAVCSAGDANRWLDIDLETGQIDTSGHY